MNRLLRSVALTAVLAVVPPASGGAQVSAREWTPIPFRVRNLTFPTVLVMSFMPRPAMSLEPGSWAFELNYSASNNFQVSESVQDYLERRGGPRRPLDQNDVDVILNELSGDRFYVDGEFELVDLGIHFGLTPRLDVSLRLSYLAYGGGYLDSIIHESHELFDFAHSGRQHIAPNRFQMVFALNGGSLVLLDRPTARGFTDPVLSVAYTSPRLHAGWKLSLEAGVKLPLGDEEEFLSTGGTDWGFQLTAQRRWRRRAVVINVGLVRPGAFEESRTFDPPELPSVNLAYLRRLGQRTTGVLQMHFSENIFREVTDSALSELEFQITIGVKRESLGGVVAFGVTENIFHYDNTPDFAVHASYGVLVGSKRELPDHIGN